MHDLFYSNKYTHTQTHIEIVNNLKNKKDKKKKKMFASKKQTNKKTTYIMSDSGKQINKLTSWF